MVDSRTLIQMLEADGWVFTEARGDHYHFKHPTKKGKITVTHPKKDLPAGTLHQILKFAGLK